MLTRPALGWSLSLLLLAAAAQAQPCGTPGRDGAGTITGIVNSYYPGNGTIAAGATSLPVGARSGATANIAAGDLLLVMQMQDAAINSTDTSSYGDGTAGGGSGSTALNSSGLYEFVVATGPVSGGSVPVLGGGNGGVTLNSYTNAAATGTQGQRRWQVIRVPQYSGVTLSSGLTALAWNGAVGGVLAIDVSGTIALGGATVSVDGKGFRGGGGRSLGGSATGFSNTAYRTLATQPWHGSKAEGIAGTPRYVYDGTTLTDTGVEGYPNGSYARGAPGNAGGGGTDGESGNGDNSGGGGGGNGGAGGSGGNTWNSNNATGGVGGGAFASTAARLALGGGGGAGSSNNAGPGHGSPGGGLILIRFNQMTGTGTLSANGLTGPDSTQDGAGGGGAGGSIFAAACNDTLNGATLIARGGKGSDVDWTAGDFHGPGGGGGGGVVRTSGAATSISVTGGANGISPNNTAYGATSGANGTSSTAATVTSAPGARPGCTCAVTQAVVSGFRAVPDGGSLVVEWETASEVKTAGFYLYRFDKDTKAWRRVNDLLAAPVAAPQGARYRLVDPAVSAREAQTYSLVEVENGGAKRTYGPFRVDPAAIGNIGNDRTLTAPDTGAARTPHLSTPAPPLPLHTERAVRTAVPTAVKLWVRETGIQKVRAADLAAALGLTEAAAADLIRQGKLSLAAGGASVSWLPLADSRDVSLLFYGRASDSLYSAESVYWLTPQGKSQIVRTVSGGSPAPAAGLAFADTVHIEQDNFPAVAVAADPEADYWYWDVLVAGDPSFGTRSLAFDLQGVAAVPGMSGIQAALTVHLQGATASGVAGEHHVAVRLNGAPLGETSWQGIAPRDLTLAVDSALLHEGSNTLEVTDLLDPGVPYSIAYIDSIDLSYARLYRAAGSALLLRGDMNKVVTVDGFTSPQIQVWDLSDPATPTALTRLTLQSAGGAYRVSFVPASPTRPYLAVDPAGLRSPRLEPWSAPETRLASPGNSADALVIAPAALAAGAERLADLRRAQGLDARVVTVEQIYDEFNDGIPSPWALQRFLFYAGTQWQHAPATAVLAGGGTYDYRNHLGYGGNLIPPLLVRTDQGLFASDPRLAQGTGIVVGRLPVTTAAELSAVIDKIAAYESSPTGAWNREVLLVADNPDEGGQFDWESDLAAALVPTTPTAPTVYTAPRIYLSQLALADARQQLLDGLNSGALLVNYLGHAGLDRLAAEPLLAAGDLPSLHNGDRLPVLAAMSCVVGRFEVPGFASLAGQLVTRPAAGAIAVWAPTGAHWNAQSGILDRAFLAALFTDRQTTLGGAVRAAAQRFRAGGGDEATLLTYNLLGDPGLLLRRTD
jgi:hypothetical protein